MISPSQIQEKNRIACRGIQTGFFMLTAVPCALGIVFCALNPVEVNRVLGTDGFMLPIIVLGFGFLYSAAATGLGFGEAWQAGCSVGFLLSKAVFFLLQWAGLVGGMFCGIMTAFAVAEAVVGLLGEVLGYLLIAGMMFLPGIGLGFLLPLAWTYCFKGAEHEREAIGYHQQALEISQKNGKKMEANFHLNSLAAIECRLGRYDKAIDCYEQALTLARAGRYTKKQAEALALLGSVYRELGQADKAAAYDKQALELEPEISLGPGPSMTK